MQQIVHSGRGSEKLEKHFTFISANRNSIVTAVSNEAPFGRPLFDFGVGLDHYFMVRLSLGSVCQQQVDTELPGMLSEQDTRYYAAWAYSKGMSHCYHELVYPRWTKHLVSPCSLFFFFSFSILLLHLLIFSPCNQGASPLPLSPQFNYQITIIFEYVLEHTHA